MYRLKSFWNSLFLSTIFFSVWSGVILLFTLTFFIPSLLFVAKLALGLVLALSVVDLLLLYSGNNITGERKVAERLSNADENTVTIVLRNKYFFSVSANVLEELPFQIHDQKFIQCLHLRPGKKENLSYFIRPKERGEYEFGNTNLLVNSPLGLITRRYVLAESQKVKVYPSFVQLQSHDFLTFRSSSLIHGSKRTRKVGNSKEFEQIKTYNKGDDYRLINWKSTAKQQRLMVNQYVAERAQDVFCIIDKGRSMKMPFKGITLLDYSINTSLALSNIALKKEDRAGMLCFSNDTSNYLKPSARKLQTQRMLNSLYNVKTDFKESDFGKLYAFARSKITNRSLLLLFTNFENLDALKRQLPYIKALNKWHLVVVILFENTELANILNQSPKNEYEIYTQTAAEKLAYDKRLILKQLKKMGILYVYTKPENLTTKTINKYMEIKERGIL